MPVTCTNQSFSLVERLVEIARAAGEAAMRFYGPMGSVDQKADGSPVTAADAEAHAVIVTALSRWDPSIPVISEEGAVPPYEQPAYSFPREW